MMNDEFLISTLCSAALISCALRARAPFQGFTASYKFTDVGESYKLSAFQGCTSPYGFSNNECPLKTLSLLSRCPFCLYCLSHPLPFMPPFSKLPQLPVKR